MTSGRGWYAFGVTTVDGAMPSDLDPKPLAERVEGLVVDDLQGILSSVELDDVLGDGPQDPAWLIPRARAHDRVLVEVASVLPVVPFTFGVVHSSVQALTEALRSRSTELEAALRHVGSSQEWTVQISPSRHRARRETGTSEGHRGRDYLSARSAELTVRDEISAVLTDLLRACDGWGIPTASLPAEEDGMGRVACLIPRDRTERVLTSLKSLPAAGAFHVELYGPLPPYHFVGDQPR